MSDARFTSSLMPLINDRITQLHAHPDVHVFNATLAPPDADALASALVELEDAGVTMDPVMRDLYTHCNGLRILWAHRSSDRLAERGEVTFDVVTSPDYGDYDPRGGSIYIAPVQTFASFEYADDLAELDELAELMDAPGEMFDELGVDAETLAMSMRVFSHRYVEEGEGLFCAQGRSFLAWSEEQCAEWIGFPNISFSMYMHHILGTFGNGHLNPWREYEAWGWGPVALPEGWDPVRALDDLVADWS